MVISFPKKKKGESLFGIPKDEAEKPQEAPKPTEFVPPEIDEKPTTPIAPNKVILNQDGSIDYAGKNWSPQEWNNRLNLMTDKGGMVTPKVEAARAQEAQYASDVAARAAGKKTTAEIEATKAAGMEAGKQIGVITPEQQALAAEQNPIVSGSATGDVLAAIGSKAAAGAATGAAAGLLGSAGTLSAPGAAVGAIGGVVVGALTIIPELKEQYIQNTKVQKITAGKAINNIKAIIEYADKGGDPVLAVGLFNQELAKIDRSERNLKALDENDWAKAKDELAAITSFNAIGRNMAEVMLYQAITNPSSSKQFDYDTSYFSGEIE